MYEHANKRVLGNPPAYFQRVGHTVDPPVHREHSAHHAARARTLTALLRHMALTWLSCRLNCAQGEARGLGAAVRWGCRPRVEPDNSRTRFLEPLNCDGFQDRASEAVTPWLRRLSRPSRLRPYFFVLGSVFRPASTPLGQQLNLRVDPWETKEAPLEVFTGELVCLTEADGDNACRAQCAGHLNGGGQGRFGGKGDGGEGRKGREEGKGEEGGEAGEAGEAGEGREAQGRGRAGAR